MCLEPTPAQRELDLRIVRDCLRLVDEDNTYTAPEIRALDQNAFWCGDVECSHFRERQEAFYCHSMATRCGSMEPDNGSAETICGCCFPTKDSERQYSQSPTNGQQQICTPPGLSQNWWAPGNLCLCPTCASDLYQLARHPLDHVPRHRNSLLGQFQHHDYLLADLAIQSFTQMGQGPRIFAQLHAQNVWRQYWDSSCWEYNALSHPNLSMLDPNYILRKPVETFNELFFLGQLPPSKIVFAWITPERNPGMDVRSIRGVTHHTEKGILIELNPFYPQHINNPEALLSTLIHEEIHAFLNNYGCYPSLTGCAIGACHALVQQNHGLEHGRSWQYLAKAIEDYASWWLSGMHVDLGRRGSAFLEMQRVDGFVPSECDLPALFPGYEMGMRMCIQRVHEEGWKGKGDAWLVTETEGVSCRWTEEETVRWLERWRFERWVQRVLEIY